MTHHVPGSDEDAPRNQNMPPEGSEVPGDTNAADIVGRTGEEMPEPEHDEVGGEKGERWPKGTA